MALPNLRERKKTATRAQIVAVADKLLLERGYDSFTLDEVAAECEVSVRTVLRYFATKEALALSHEYELQQRFRREMNNRAGSVLDFWRSWVRELSAVLVANEDWNRRRLAAIRQGTVYLSFIAIQREGQRLLADELEAEAQGEHDRLAPQLLAAMLTAGNEAMISEWLQGRRPFDPRSIVEVVDYAIDVFDGRLGRANPVTN